MRQKRGGITLLILFVGAYILGNLIVGVVLADEGILVVEQEEAEQEEEETAALELTPAINNLDTVWVLLAGFLVFFMQAGFALVEAGFVRAQNVVNIFMKNLFDLSLGAICYWAIGFGVMFGAGNQFFGTEWFQLNGLPEVYPGLAIPGYAFFFFQFAFAATAATIAAGVIAGRADFGGYLLCSVVVTMIIYPIVGHWIWHGDGWLAQLGFSDFAGSTVVHSTGAWIGLIGAIVIGPRRGRFGKHSAPIPGHSMTLVGLGTFILWLGWFGFNPGSALSADGSAIAHITVTTNLAAAAGAIAAMLLGWYSMGKPQLPWALNGALAGLVSITAATDAVTPTESLIIGAIGGIIMYFGVNYLESKEIDDVVGAVSVHGFCGVWGTLAVGIFAAESGLLHGGGLDQLVNQFIGVVGVAVFVVIASWIMFQGIKMVLELRAPEEAEIFGLDIYEHGLVAYPEFTNSPSQPTPPRD